MEGVNDSRIQELKSLLPRCLLPDWVRLGGRASRWLHETSDPVERSLRLDRLITEARQSVEFCELRRQHVPKVTYPESLPITARRAEIVEAIRRNPVVVLAGETGSGKTTQIPKMCLEAGLGVEAMIGCTQPRRVAALSISQRIAEELQVPWGREVGCKIRFDDRTGPETYIKLMTDGILLAETQGDPLLSEYNAIIIDEAHERSLNIDFLLGWLKGLIVRRADLKLVITSATIDTEIFSRHFGNAPVIEVSGRTYPVDVLYAPEGDLSRAVPPRAGVSESAPVSGTEIEVGEPADTDFVSAAVRAAESILLDSDGGDLLIFLPGERDIREASDLLDGRYGREVEVVPLYGRLSSGDQQRVFASIPRRKVVVATNIAETSLTIPGIRFVIDAGLARISHYNPRTRTRRLPVEPVSQSSANQRKGRAGRVEAGICIRLYPEEDFLSRQAFTPPEIQRSNLAEVILRMMAFGLGDIETFPFLQPPSPSSIAGGFALLQELGALDDQRRLTDIGRELARLPIDPTLGRMLLQSREERSTRELLVIAAGMSIQDPRERPLDNREAADAAHRRHAHSQSDFLGLLNLWNAVHEPWESLRTQNARRKFCRQNFLSYLRMREWQEVHSQLEDALGTEGAKPDRAGPTPYEAIHRAILAGLLGHVAHREERNLYKAAGNREVMVFPGSALFDRAERSPRGGPRGSKSASPPKPEKAAQPEWVVAGEVVETSQRFARTIAGIEPTWILQLAPHLCKVAHQNPHWSPEAGRVLVEEVVTFQGFEIQRHKVAYGPLKPEEATAIFIRSALVEETLFPVRQLRGRRTGARNPLEEAEEEAADSVESDLEEAFRRFPFLAENHAVRQKIETWQTRMRHHQLDLDQALYRFYQARIFDVSSVAELQRLVNGLTERTALHVRDGDLVGDRELGYDADAFPDEIVLLGRPVELTYAYAPGEETDGVTLRLPSDLVGDVSAASVFWSVPGLRLDQAKELLESLPKSLRRELQPFAPKCPELARGLVVGTAPLGETLSVWVRDHYQVSVPSEAWKPDTLPAHLRPRLEVLDPRGRVLGSSRDLAALRAHLHQQIAQSALKVTDDAPFWRKAVQQWERYGMRAWSCGDLPSRITVHEGTGPTVYAWPGLQEEEGGVSVRLFRTEGKSREASLRGLGRLVELALEKELAWLEKDLRAVSRLEGIDSGIGTGPELEEASLRCLKRYLLPATLPAVLTQASFHQCVEAARRLLPGLGQQLIDRLRTLLQIRAQVRQRMGSGSPPAAAVAVAPRAQRLTDLSQLGSLTAASGGTAKTAAPSWSSELSALLPHRFPEHLPFERLHHVARYLKALLLRIERAAANPPKDQERARLVAPYSAALRQWQELAGTRGSAALAQEVAALRWMVEEYKVSLYAQELGTAMPVSPKRLDEQLETIRRAG